MTEQQQRVPVVKRLTWGNATTDIGQVAQLVFEQLVKLALPVVRSYHSDLYHDALWLAKHLQGQALTFYFSADECGTTIGTEVRYATRDRAYEVTVSVAGGMGSMSIVDIRPPASAEQVRCATLGCKAPATVRMTYTWQGDGPQVDEVCQECADGYARRVVISVTSVEAVA